MKCMGKELKNQCLADNGIGCDGTKALCEVIKVNTTLKTFGLSGIGGR